MPFDASIGTCAAYAYHAIEHHLRVTRLPAACGGLTPEQVSRAAATAIRRAAVESGGTGGGGKEALRHRAAESSSWVGALITQPVARPPSGLAVTGTGGVGGGRLGGVSESAIDLAALLAWTATAASGAFVLFRWLLAPGARRLRPAPAAHASLGMAGLAGWALFMITGWPWLAWACLVPLLPVAGLGMSVLLTGPGRRIGPPWAVIAGHGIAAAALMVLVITATVAA